MDLSWMGWTTPTALFFAFIGTALLIMIAWGIIAPQAPRVGILRIETTPGDRFFISLLGSAFICLFWLALFGAPLRGALVCCLVYAICVFRWV